MFEKIAKRYDPIVIAPEKDLERGQGDQQKGRGYISYAQYRDVSVTGRDKQGTLQSVQIEQQWGELDPLTKVQIYQKCAPVFNAVTSIANRIASLDFNILPYTKAEDQIVHELKKSRDIYNENASDNYFGLGRRIKCLIDIRKILPDVFPDLSNFEGQLKRWSASIRQKHRDRSEEIKEFFLQPATGIQWTEHTKEEIADLLIHGRTAIYKQPLIDIFGKKEIHSLYVLPGGSVYPIKGKYVGQKHGYIQMVDGFEEPQIFQIDELTYMQYMPNSGLLNGSSPIDALVNLVSENLLFNEYMAKLADGSERPDKVLVFGDRGSGMSPASADDLFSDQIDKGEQRRIEMKLNRIKREAGVAVLTGLGTPFLADMSKADTLANQMARQEQIIKYVAMCFNLPQIDANQTGSDDTSGRSTSETQERIITQKTIMPILKLREEKYSREIIPQKFGYGYFMQHLIPKSEEENIANAKSKLDSGAFSVNEIRTEDFQKDAYEGEEFNLPKAATPAQQGMDALSGSIAEKLK